VRERIREIYHARKNGAPVSYVDLYHMNVAFQVLPVEALVPLYDDYLSEVEQVPASTGARHRILISGSVVSDVDIMERIEALGGAIVVDDTCLGYRLVRDRVERGDEPISTLAAYYLERPLCSARSDFPGRKKYVSEAIAAFEVDAVIFLHQKFCDPHCADHPFLKEVLKQDGIPQLRLELEGEGLDGQTQTRLESFFEMLDGK
jgi:benzoyl-CoA reductase subunit C